MYRFIFLLIAAGIMWAGCHKTTTEKTSYKGVVIYDVCDNIVIQSLGPDYIGQDSWVDRNNTERPVYRHVFKVANPCQFRQHSYGDTISFQLIAPQLQRCTLCQASLAMPDTAYTIHVDE